MSVLFFFCYKTTTKIKYKKRICLPACVPQLSPQLKQNSMSYRIADIIIMHIPFTIDILFRRCLFCRITECFLFCFNVLFALCLKSEEKHLLETSLTDMYSTYKLHLKGSYSVRTFFYIFHCCLLLVQHRPTMVLDVRDHFTLFVASCLSGHQF